jgi:hypothetical protein
MATQDRIELFGNGRVVRCGIRTRLLDGLSCLLRNHPVLFAAIVGAGLAAGGATVFSVIGLWPEIAALLK